MKPISRFIKQLRSARGKSVKRSRSAPATFISTYSADLALDNTRVSRRNRLYPQAGDQRISDGQIFPWVEPRFRIQENSRVFTIGSCFAREIEENLAGFDLPTMQLNVPKEIVAGRSNSILNEYNVGSIAQRIDFTLTGRSTRTILGIHESQSSGYIDLLLSKGTFSTIEDGLVFRDRIDHIYRLLPVSDAVIITLGMTEVWFDNETGVYLNRLPSTKLMRDRGTRYEFRNFSVQGCYNVLAPALEALRNTRARNIILTVSPVPLTATFEPNDCVIANAYSKSTLRAAVDMLRRDLPFVEYFPSYEIALSGGLNSYQEDHIHIKPALVRSITNYFNHLFVA